MGNEAQRLIVIIVVGLGMIAVAVMSYLNMQAAKAKLDAFDRRVKPNREKQEDDF